MVNAPLEKRVQSATEVQRKGLLSRALKDH